MPDIREGLELNGEPVVKYEEGDVNAPGGFEAALAARVAEQRGEEPETPAEEPAASGEEATGGEPASQETPAAEPEAAIDWQQRYEEQQRVMGRMGQELGERRTRESELEARLNALESRSATTAAATGPIDLEGAIEQHGGNTVVQWAIDNAPDMIDDAVNQWARTGDPEGMMFHSEYVASKASLESAPQKAEPDPVQQDMTRRHVAELVFKEASADIPNFEQVAEGLEPALQNPNVPQEFKEMLTSGQLDDARQGFKYLLPYVLIEAARKGVDVTTPAPAKPVAQPAEPQAETDETARRAAARSTAIVSGSQTLQEAGVQPSGELTAEERTARFKQQFFDVEDTDIMSGLTINGKPVREKPTFVPKT